MADEPKRYPARMVEVPMGDNHWYVVEAVDDDGATMTLNLRGWQVEGDPRIGDTGYVRWRPGAPWAPDSGVHYLRWEGEDGP